MLNWTLEKSGLKVSAGMVLVVGSQTAAATAMQGNNALTAGNFDLALQLADQALALKTTDFNSHYLRFNALTGLKRAEEALQALSSTIELNADYVEARLKRAQIYIDKSRLDEAELDLNHAIAKKPTNTLAKKLLAKVSGARTATQTADFLNSESERERERERVD
jgi:tetratricopeptide (TPR) repeat protein